MHFYSLAHLNSGLLHFRCGRWVGTQQRRTLLCYLGETDQQWKVRLERKTEARSWPQGSRLRQNAQFWVALKEVLLYFLLSTIRSHRNPFRGLPCNVLKVLYFIRHSYSHISNPFTLGLSWMYMENSWANASRGFQTVSFRVPGFQVGASEEWWVGALDPGPMPASTGGGSSIWHVVACARLYLQKQHCCFCVFLAVWRILLYDIIFQNG